MKKYILKAYNSIYNQQKYNFSAKSDTHPMKSLKTPDQIQFIIW